MLAEVRMAHALQRVRGEARDPRLGAAEVFGLMWDGGARVIGSCTSAGRLEPGRRGDVVLMDLRALCAPYAAADADVWELLLSRGKAAHVDSVIVGGRVLMQGRKHLHVDRDALMEEVAGAAASAIARRNADDGPCIAELGRRIAEHYQAPVWHDD
jgi:5-methylthioadenosine/S-adenosylhomocysteine deaminase